jgi:hypothetical protein
VWYSRLDGDVRWTPLPDELLTILDELCIASLLVVKPGGQGAPVAKALTVKGGLGEGASQEKDSDDEEGDEGNIRWTGRHG